MLTNLQAATIEHFGVTREGQPKARRIAGKLFDRQQALARRAMWMARLSGRPNALHELPGWAQPDGRVAGTLIVSLRAIVGTEGRSRDFDAAFRPLRSHLRERWVSVAAARRMGLALPPVELLRHGGEYYVRDGHHRISVARAMGQVEIEARIVNG